MMLTKVKVTPQEVIDDGSVSVEDAAGVLGVSVDTIYDLMNDEALPYIKVRSGKRIPRAGLKKYIQENLVQS